MEHCIEFIGAMAGEKARNFATGNYCFDDSAKLWWSYCLDCG